MRYLALLLIGLSSIAVAEEIHEMRVEVKVADEDGSLFTLDSDTLGFDMRDMQVGENRSYTDDDGRNILMTRTESGYTVDVDGKSFDLPEFGSEAQLIEAEMYAHGLQAEIEQAIEIAHAHEAKRAAKEILVLSGDDIDAQTQEAVRMALQAGGYEKPVNFVNSADRIVERKVWVSKSENLIH